MKCHYAYDKKAGKFWLPGCWGGMYGPEGCTCRDNPTNKTFAEFERQVYNEKVAELKKENAELEKEIYRLNRIIKKILKK